MSEHESEVRPPEGAADKTARALSLDLGLRGLDEPAVRHARRTHGLAGAAVETEGERLHRRVREADPALRERLDEEDAPTRRVHLRPQLGERRTGREAQAAVHAL